MLNKDVCRKCMNKFIHKSIYWDMGDEADWAERKRVCCYGATFEYHPISLPPPEGCPYRFEHAVSEGIKDAQ